MEISIDLTTLLAVLFGHLAIAGVLTWRYGRRTGSPSAGAALLIIFAWLVPVLGAACLGIFLAASARVSATA